MRMPAFFLALIAALVFCAGCGAGSISLPGETLYTVSCDNDPGDCRAGAQMLCGGPYETVGGSGSGEKKRTGDFGWVDVDGSQSDAGSGGGRYSLRIRCTPQP